MLSGAEFGWLGDFAEPWPLCFRAPVGGDGGVGDLVVDVAKGGVVAGSLASAPFGPVALIIQPGTNTTRQARSCDRCQLASCCIGIYIDARLGFHNQCCVVLRHVAEPGVMWRQGQGSGSCVQDLADGVSSPVSSGPRGCAWPRPSAGQPGNPQDCCLRHHWLAGWQSVSAECVQSREVRRMTRYRVNSRACRRVIVELALVGPAVSYFARSRVQRSMHACRFAAG